MLTILANQLRRVVIAGGYLVATALIVPVFAQSGANIAGNYRGLMTKCIGASQPNICRTALKELVRLADEVDALKVAERSLESPTCLDLGHAPAREFWQEAVGE
jgi:hypothetical protein